MKAILIYLILAILAVAHTFGLDINAGALKLSTLTGLRHCNRAEGPFKPFFHKDIGGDMVSTGNQGARDACRRRHPLRYQVARKLTANNNYALAA